MYAGQVEVFRRAVEEGVEPLATGEDGLRAAEVTLAMVESARSGKRVSPSARKEKRSYVAVRRSV